VYRLLSGVGAPRSFRNAKRVFSVMVFGVLC
jgi:hypothetical protein